MPVKAAEQAQHQSPTHTDNSAGWGQLSESAYGKTRELLKEPLVQELAVGALAVTAAVLSRRALTSAAIRYLPKLATAVGGIDTIVAKETAPIVERTTMGTAIREAEPPRRSMISAVHEAEPPRRSTITAVSVDTRTRIIPHQFPSQDTEAIRGLTSVPFKGPYRGHSEAPPYREFLITGGDNPYRWQSSTVRGDHSVQQIFQAREILTPSRQGSALGPEIKVLLQHHDGVSQPLNQRLARQADLIACCHAERLPLWARSKHALSSVRGPVHISTVEMHLPALPSGQAHVFSIGPWRP